MKLYFCGSGNVYFQVSGVNELETIMALSFDLEKDEGDIGTYMLDRNDYSSRIGILTSDFLSKENYEQMDGDLPSINFKPLSEIDGIICPEADRAELERIRDEVQKMLDMLDSKANQSGV